jgi:hypothetical protein
MLLHGKSARDSSADLDRYGQREGGSALLLRRERRERRERRLLGGLIAFSARFETWWKGYLSAFTKLSWWARGADGSVDAGARGQKCEVRVARSPWQEIVSLS